MSKRNEISVSSTNLPSAEVVFALMEEDFKRVARRKELAAHDARMASPTTAQADDEATPMKFMGD